VTAWKFALGDGDFTDALAGFAWPDAFVRELSLVSPTKLVASGDVLSPGATPDARVVIATPSGPIHGVDVHVHLADDIQYRAGQPLDASVRVARTSVEFVLGHDAGRIRGRALRFRALELPSLTGDCILGRGYPPDAEFDDDHFWQPR
jgi:hypothetical protein